MLFTKYQHSFCQLTTWLVISSIEESGLHKWKSECKAVCVNNVQRYEQPVAVVAAQILVKDGELNKLSRKEMQPRKFFLVFLTLLFSIIAS